jgi:hypothetical protein
MALFKVRSEFFVHLDGKVFEPGTELELTPEQAELVLHQVELLPEPKPARKAKEPG